MPDLLARWRKRRLKRLGLELLDLEHDRRKWGYADTPSERILRDERIAKIKQKLEASDV